MADYFFLPGASRYVIDIKDSEVGIKDAEIGAKAGRAASDDGSEHRSPPQCLQQTSGLISFMLQSLLNETVNVSMRRTQIKLFRIRVVEGKK